MLNVAVYIVGWILYVAAQAQNSVTSKTNSLPAGWTGLKFWLSKHAVNLATRAFFSALFYGLIVNTVTAKIHSAGMNIAAVSIAGTAGYTANTLLYQIFGYIPWLRVEVSDFAPPAKPETVPQSTASVPNSNSGAN
jgi:hypothetical protein